MTDEFDFSGSTGATHAGEAMKQNDFAKRLEFLSLDATPAGVAQGKNQGLYRFLTDFRRQRPDEPMTKFNLAWITVMGHYAQTKPKPVYVDEKAKWPEKMGGGCRHEPVFKKKYNDQCYICDVIKSKPSKRVWALAVEREGVRDEKGAVIGYRDKTREVFAEGPDGKFIEIGKTSDGKAEYQKEIVPAYVVMSMGWRNFFQPLDGQAQYFASQGGSGLLDGDWLITRTGTDNNDTSYAPVRVAQQQLPAENPWGLPEGTTYDLAIPGLMEAIYPDMPDLRQVLADRVSDDYFGRFWIPGWLPEGFDPAKASGSTPAVAVQNGGAPMMAMSPSTPAPEAPSAPAAEAPPTDALAALKNRVTSG